MTYTFTHASEYVIVFEAVSGVAPDTSDFVNVGAYVWIMTGCFATATIFPYKRKKKSVKEN